jgi:hypothetical protein
MSSMKIDCRWWQNHSTIPSIDKIEKKSRPAALDHLSHGQHNADGCVPHWEQIAGQYGRTCRASAHRFVCQCVTRATIHRL